MLVIQWSIHEKSAHPPYVEGNGAEGIESVGEAMVSSSNEAGLA